MSSRRMQMASWYLNLNGVNTSLDQMFLPFPFSFLRRAPKRRLMKTLTWTVLWYVPCFEFSSKCPPDLNAFHFLLSFPGSSSVGHRCCIECGCVGPICCVEFCAILWCEEWLACVFRLGYCEVFSGSRIFLIHCCTLQFSLAISGCAGLAWISGICCLGDMILSLSVHRDFPLPLPLPL